MDLFGFPGYKYDQSDELSNQMFAQQNLGSSAPYFRETSTPYAMPKPTDGPYDMRDMPWGMSSPPQLVQFTAQPLSSEPSYSPALHCKRKSLLDENVVPPKQFITEEKMAAHLSGLHISSDYTAHTLASEKFMDARMETSPATLSEKLKGHTIVLSKEIKKLREDPLLPASLIERLEKPCMSLMVWKPKEDVIPKLPEEEEEKIDSTTENYVAVRRSGVLVLDETGMDVEM